MGEITKTLELKLVDPNLHKRQKLRETRDAYQQALQATFTAGCDTQSAANDVVINYDLSGYAKNALKKYVPQLCGGSYDAKELHDDHPVRFTNEGPKLDHKTPSSGTSKSRIIDGSHPLEDACRRHSLDFRDEKRGNRNSVERVFRERKRRTTSFSNCFSNAEADIADKWLRSFGFAWNQFI